MRIEPLYYRLEFFRWSGKFQNGLEQVVDSAGANQLSCVSDFNVHDEGVSGQQVVERRRRSWCRRRLRLRLRRSLALLGHGGGSEDRAKQQQRCQGCNFHVRYPPALCVKNQGCCCNERSFVVANW